ncbi:unnamed protein product, partial [Iphiclides podalirius]
MAEEDDEGTFGGLYEDGHWIWDDTTQALVFISDLPPKPVETFQIPTKAPTGTVEFRDDVDLIEQIRFRRRYQRKLKPGQADVITLQDVKDIALFTAPVNIMSPMLINLLHLPTTERFIRALIIYSQYYLQTADEMARRILELDTKVRTPQCRVLESEFRDNLSDLRLLVAKEYSTMIIGGGDTRKFHHMGAQKKRKSLSDKDARLFETFLRMDIDYRLLGLGVVKYAHNSSRLLYMMQAVAGPEESLAELGIVLGIIGKARSLFDTVLRPLPTSVDTGKSKVSMSSSSSYSAKSTGSMKKSTTAVQKLYDDIVLPKKETRTTYFPPTFPDASAEIRPCSEVQRLRWLNRLARLLNPQTTVH